MFRTVDFPLAASAANSMDMPARISGLSKFSLYNWFGPCTRQRYGSHKMILAPIPTSLSVKYMRPENIQSWNITEPVAWVATVIARLIKSVGKAGQTFVLISG